MRRRAFIGRVTAAVSGLVMAPVVLARSLASNADAVSDIPALMDQMWDGELLQTTIPGQKYARQGQPDSGHWGAAKALRDRVKAAAAGQPAPSPAPPPAPTVTIDKPAEGATVSGMVTISGTATG